MIFTIGHSNHRIERFLVLLAHHRIDAVADVRSSPHSRFYPQFNREELSESVKAAGMYYVFMGDELGARRTEPNCYVDGKARYDLIAQTPLFQEGITRIRDGASRLRIALMCAEKDPLTCHRAILVCRHLRSKEVAISHILYDGNIEPHNCLEERLLKAVGVNGKDLIHSHSEAVEYAYQLQGDRIAFVRNRELQEEKD